MEGDFMKRKRGHKKKKKKKKQNKGHFSCDLILGTEGKSGGGAAYWKNAM